MKQADKMNNDNEKSLLGKVWQIALVLGAIIGVVSGVDAYIKSHREPTITIFNHLALPIIVKVNDSSAYSYRIESGTQKTVTLYSEDDFPAKMHWSVIQNKNAGGKEIGEALSGNYSKIDKGKEISIEYILGTDAYFYPVIKNKLDEKCLIVINDGLAIQYVIGVSNPHKTTSITGYFKYAKNSNVTLYCNNKPYWRGIRNKQSSGESLPIQSKSGITEMSFP